MNGCFAQKRATQVVALGFYEWLLLTQSGRSETRAFSMSRLRNIEWHRLGIEAAAIVVSILLAFWIDAWWDLRSQGEEARAYLAALETELLENRRIIDGDLEDLRSWVADSRSFLEDVVSPSAEPSNEQINRMIYETNPSETTPLLTAALEDLKSSGVLPAIESAELRRAIADYDRRLDRVESRLDFVSDNFREYILRYHIQHSSFSESGWEENAEVEESLVSFESDTEAFAANRTYANLLILRILGYSGVRRAHIEVQTQIDRVLELIPDASER